MPQCHGFATPWTSLRAGRTGICARVVLLVVMFLPSVALSCDRIDALLEPVRLVRAGHGGIEAIGQGRLRFASFRPASGQESAIDAALQPLFSPPEGSLVEAAILGPADRWGERPAILALRASDGSARYFPEALVAGGAGLAWPEALDDPCFPVLEQGEQAAQERRAGLWRDGLPVVDDPSGKLPETAIGKPVSIRARVESVVFRRQRAYVNFGAAYRSRISVLVELPRQAEPARALRAQISDLAGRKVLIRGIAETGKDAPRVVVRDARQIRIVDEGSR